MKTTLPLIFLVLCYCLVVLPAQAFAATLSLTPASGTFNKSCSFSVDVILNTGGVGADGTDVYLLYDISRVTATNIATGHLYSDYSGTNIDNQAGKVAVSGVSSDSAYNGTGTFATISFVVKDTGPTGVTQIKFDFDTNYKSKVSD